MNQMTTKLGGDAGARSQLVPALGVLAGEIGSERWGGRWEGGRDLRERAGGKIVALHRTVDQMTLSPVTRQDFATRSDAKAEARSQKQEKKKRREAERIVTYIQIGVSMRTAAAVAVATVAGKHPIKETESHVLKI